MRSEAARLLCSCVIWFDICIKGLQRWPKYVMKAIREPSVRSPSRTQMPPYKMMSAVPKCLMRSRIGPKTPI